MSLGRLERNWNAFAAKDPLWSILTWDEKRGRRWEVDEFFATGRAEVARVLAAVRDCRPELRTGRALDFGCGVGRLSLALADVFDEVDGVDIAAKMIALAREFDRAGRVRYHVNRGAGLPFADGEFDFAYSSITLQHMAPRWIRGYLRELVRVLAPGGLVVFQLPEKPVATRHANPLRRAVGRIVGPVLLRVRRLASRGPVMEMFGLPTTEVEAILARSGCRLLRAEASGMGGADWDSWLYVAVRV